MSELTLTEAALYYARRGWPVFPLSPGSKVPLIARTAGGHGMHDATADLEQIDAWWSRCPRANVGLRTGDVFDVLDVDVKTANGFASLVAQLDEHGCLPPGPSAATPSGGAHFYFRPTGCGNTTNLLPGLDWRGAGGYVVAPPSAVDGAVYEWGFPPSTSLSDVPPWLLAHLQPESAGVIPAESSRLARPATSYGQRALEGEVGRLLMAPQGDRNHALNRAAFSLGRLVGGGVLEAREVVEALVLAAERIGLEAHEIENTIRSGLTKGMAQPRRVPA